MMWIRWLSLAWAVSLGCGSPVRADEPLGLSVLYAGHPGSVREQDFLSFLRGHVRRVDAADYRTLTADRARGFDVILFDWTSLRPLDPEARDAGGVESPDIPSPPALSRGFDRPALLIGQAGGYVADSLGLKATGLCQCLEDAVHDLASAHELFRGPCRVALPCNEQPIPDHYLAGRRQRTGAVLMLAGLSVLAASVIPFVIRLLLGSPAAFGNRERKGRRRDPLTVGPGIISTVGFLMTCAGGVAMWRDIASHRATMKVYRIQAEPSPATDYGLVYDPYGFEDSPDAEFIASGLNGKDPRALALGRQGNFFLWGFSGPPSEMTPGGRALFLNALCYIRRFDGARPLVYHKQQSREWALVHARNLDRAGYDPALARRYFPAVLRECFGDDAARYVAYYRENLEYLRPAAVGFEVDEEVRSLGVSNRRIDFLDRCVSMLERGDRVDLAARAS